MLRTPSSSPTISAAKLIVRDLPDTQRFYERFFGLKEQQRSQVAGGPLEVCMGFDAGAQLVLVAPSAEQEPQQRRSQFPLVLLCTPELDAVVERLDAAGSRARILGDASTRVALTRDPSGNRVEILSRPDAPAAVGGSKLSVEDRKDAEAFFTRIFGVEPMRRYRFPGFDEVLLAFGDGPFLALFQANGDEGLVRSRFAVTRFRAPDPAVIAERLRAEGAPVDTALAHGSGHSVLLSRDPSGNVIEILGG